MKKLIIGVCLLVLISSCGGGKENRPLRDAH